MRCLVVLAVVLALAAAACADDGGDAKIADPSTTSAPVVTVPDYAAQIADLPEARDDRSLPGIDPDGPVGAYGFSRYVY